MNSTDVAMSDCDSAMARQTRSIPQLMREQFEDLEPKTRELFSTQEIYSFQKIILTGCGDSYAACLAAKQAFEDFTRIPVEVIAVIDLARHCAKKKFNAGPNSPLLIAVSSSGNVARLHESLLRATNGSAFTLGITKNLESALGKSARRILKLDAPAFESSPGVRSYMISLLALFLLAIRIGEVKMTYTMDQAKRYRKGLQAMAARMSEFIENCEELVFQMASAWREFPGFDYIGSGSDYASVFFGQAKIIEAVGRYAMHINTEEWMHLNFFIRNSEKTGTVVIFDSKNPAKSRMKELLEYVQMNARPLLVITDDEEIQLKKGTVFIYPEVDHPSFAALYQMLPLSFLAAYLSSFAGETYGRGLEGNWAFARGASAIKESVIEVLS